MNYSERARALEQLAIELERLERQSSADDVDVSVRERDGVQLARIAFEYEVELENE